MRIPTLTILVATTLWPLHTLAQDTEPEFLSELARAHELSEEEGQHLSALQVLHRIRPPETEELNTDCWRPHWEGAERRWVRSLVARTRCEPAGLLLPEIENGEALPLSAETQATITRCRAVLQALTVENVRQAEEQHRSVSSRLERDISRRFERLLERRQALPDSRDLQALARVLRGYLPPTMVDTVDPEEVLNRCLPGREGAAFPGEAVASVRDFRQDGVAIHRDCATVYATVHHVRPIRVLLFNAPVDEESHRSIWVRQGRDYFLAMRNWWRDSGYYEGSPQPWQVHPGPCPADDLLQADVFSSGRPVMEVTEEIDRLKLAYLEQVGEGRPAGWTRARWNDHVQSAWERFSGAANGLQVSDVGVVVDIDGQDGSYYARVECGLMRFSGPGLSDDDESVLGRRVYFVGHYEWPNRQRPDGLPLYSNRRGYHPGGPGGDFVLERVVLADD